MPIRRLCVILVVLSDLVEIIFVQLPNETSKVAVFEVLRQDLFGEFLVLHLHINITDQDSCSPCEDILQEPQSSLLLHPTVLYFHMLGLRAF